LCALAGNQRPSRPCRHSGLSHLALGVSRGGRRRQERGVRTGLATSFVYDVRASSSNLHASMSSHGELNGCVESPSQSTSDKHFRKASDTQPQKNARASMHPEGLAHAFSKKTSAQPTRNEMAPGLSPTSAKSDAKATSSSCSLSSSCGSHSATTCSQGIIKSHLSPAPVTEVQVEMSFEEKPREPRCASRAALNNRESVSSFEMFSECRAGPEHPLAPDHGASDAGCSHVAQG